MTLIVGLRGLNKSFLAADSRVTNRVTGDYRDDVSKWINFGRFATSVVAGNISLAAYICKALLAIVGEDPSYIDVKTAFDRDIESLAVQFNKVTGEYRNCVIMLAGYRSDQKDSFDMGKIGLVMGASVQKAKWKTVNQSIDQEILNAMDNVYLSKGGVAINIVEADSYEALIYGADTANNRLELPTESISEIYFRDVKGQDDLSIISFDGIHFVAFINQTIRNRKLNNVGGNVIPLFITPQLCGFASGQVGMFNSRTGQPEILTDIEVIEGKMHYKDQDGKYKPYKSFLEIDSKPGLSNSLEM